ncbi:MAG: hypoxanthine-guanine phosphoribosyltransferase [Candidatus Contendobacter odensis]|uniref:Hypoxanthine-guanine phosphoribosyltransferase n=1 Tax=Candidatus Contendibacter odensensis TaxID=1400860 RepID=A0A2G6PEG2_9GAMM|nr:MAG: hypoxanthine-guanine phosphoribosyltransferase [Candidatus Contendobacter odensis]
MPAITPQHALKVLHEAELLCTQEQIGTALDQLAAAITMQLGDLDPLVLIVMNGAFIPAAQLLARLNFPLQVGYLHATRYRSDTQGKQVDWIAPPHPAATDRTVLVIDDIFDEGDTLKAILEALQQQGATAVYSAVLVDKRHDRKVAGLNVDFIGLETPDRYLFGCGMDYKEYWRQLPAIYAVRD